MTIQELAEKYVAYAQRRTRDNGEKFWFFESEDEDLRDLIFKSHDSGDVMPDDHRYAFIRDALLAIAEADEEWLEDPDFPYDTDISNYEAAMWLASRNDRAAYVDEYAQEFGVEAKNFSVISLISQGYAAEKREVFQSVLSSLQALATDDEEDSDA